MTNTLYNKVIGKGIKCHTAPQRALKGLTPSRKKMGSCVCAAGSQGQAGLETQYPSFPGSEF